jgi:hypothetical protein
MKEARRGDSVANGASSAQPGVGVLGIEDVARVPRGQANMETVQESRMQEERRARHR